MSRDDAPAADPVGDDLVAWGRGARLETRGRRTGLRRQVVVGFVEEPDGSILVAAGARAGWALNLLADPRCDVTIGDRALTTIALPLAGADHARAVRELILRGGTPAEGLGHGPSFRLVPARVARIDRGRARPAP